MLKRMSTCRASICLEVIVGPILICWVPSFCQSQAEGAFLTHQQTDPAVAPSFEVATIKPANPNGGPMGTYTYPGGKIFVGQSTLRMLVQTAFNLQAFQVSGGPAWAGNDAYDIVAVPSDSSASRQSRPVSRNAPLNDEQRKMLQTLLIDRFGLKFHREAKEGPVYILSRSNKKLQMEDSKDKDGLPYLLSLLKAGGVADGSMVGNNISMSLLATRLSKYLERPVIDQTGLKGSFDFDLPASDPSNHDVAAAIIDSLSRLGLKLKAGKGTLETIVIDSASKPTPN